MATITTRAGKGSPLTNGELDANFNNLNAGLAAAAITSGTITNTAITTGSINNTPVGATTANTGAFTTLSASSTVSGTGFSSYLAAPPAIGGTTPAAGAFTTLSASSTVSGTGFSSYLAAPPAIGGTTPAAGAFTTLSASGLTTLTNTTEATSSSAAAVVLSGGLGVAKTIWGATGIKLGSPIGTPAAWSPNYVQFGGVNEGGVYGSGTAAVGASTAPITTQSVTAPVVTIGSSNTGVHACWQLEAASGTFRYFTAPYGNGAQTMAKKVELNLYGIGVGGAAPSSGAGITFPATQSASTDANTLDDYEEGTWTLTRNSFTEVIGGGSITNTGTYTKQGNIVTASCRIVCAGGATLASTNGTSNITGWPFACNSSFLEVGKWANVTTAAAGGNVVFGSTTAVYIVTGSWTASTSTWEISVTYFV